jgi:hypothetical protein
MEHDFQGQKLKDATKDAKCVQGVGIVQRGNLRNPENPG